MLRESERAALAHVRGGGRQQPRDGAHARRRLWRAGRAHHGCAARHGSRAAGRAAKQSGPVALLTVGAVVPRKGHDVLIEALAGLIDLPWRLTIVGDCGRDLRDGRAAQGRHRAASARPPRHHRGCGRRPTRLAALYASSDLFVLPSRYEGFGMAYAEAIAYGLPVIGTTAGAIPETVPAQAGVLVPPGRRRRARRGAAPADRNPAEREQLAAGARGGRRSFRPGADRPSCSPGRSRGSYERVLGELADAARALRPARAQCARCSMRSPPGRRERSSVAVVDLACGLGSTLRAVSERLPRRQSWRLVDNDLSLLARAGGARAAARPDGDGGAGRSRARPRGGARRAGRAGHHLGAARSRVA